MANGLISMNAQKTTTAIPPSASQSEISSLSKNVQSLTGRVHLANNLYIGFLALTLLASILIIKWNGKLSSAKDDLQRAKDTDVARELKGKDVQIAKLEKDTADARLELAKIDPLNLPIRSIRADIFLMVRADFLDWLFDKAFEPAVKGGASSVSVTIDGKGGLPLVKLQCEKFESILWFTTPDKGEPDGRTFSMSFVWPTTDALEVITRDMFRYWIDRNNASTAMLDKELGRVFISLPPTKELHKPAEILQSSCVVTINGSIRRNFSVPKSSVTYNIFCPLKKD